MGCGLRAWWTQISPILLLVAPALGTLKLNFDGSYIKEETRGRIRGIFHLHDGTIRGRLVLLMQMKLKYIPY